MLRQAIENGNNTRTVTIHIASVRRKSIGKS